MKKLCTILGAALLSVSLTAQTFGLKAGLNMGNVTNGSDLQEQYDAINASNKSLLGLSLGVDAAFELSDALDLNAGFSFIQKGTVISVDGVDDNFTTKINFLDVAPAVAYNITEELSANVGPYVGFALSGSQTVQNIDVTTGETTTTTESIDFDEDEIATMDYGLNVGVSYVINEMIAINAGYSLGLSDLNASDQGDLDLSQKTNGIHFSVGYIFGDGY